MAGTENYNELCRLCASKINLLIGINIFEGEGSLREINKKISTCLPIQVHEADRLPKMICGDCDFKLDLFFTFRKKSIETENLLIDLVRKENNKVNIEKMKVKIITQNTMDIVTTMNEQQLQIVQNTQELLEHSSLTLNHLSERDTIMVNQEMILNHENITIQNHELDNIEISASELNSHNMSHETIHDQQLLHHEPTMVQLVQQEIQMRETHLAVQNLELMQHEHNLITNEYERLKHIEIDENTSEKSYIRIKDQRNLFKEEEEVENKSENQAELLIVKATYSDGSESDELSDPESEVNNEVSTDENVKNNLIESNIFDNQNQLKLSTTEITTESVVYYCNVCGKTMNDNTEYLDHYSEHINKCLHCQISFSSLEDLLAHRKQMHTSKSVNKQSNKPSVKNKSDENFFKEESSEDDNPPENNSEQFNDDEEESENNKNIKRKRWEPKVCSECGKTYKTNYKLAEHMRKHTGEQPFKCTQCDKAFRSKIGLAQHEAKHTGQYDYSCPTCGKGFQCKSYLIVHQRVHSSLKPFPCSTCGRNFKSKQSLLDHENRHLGVKPYVCDVCGRGFITKGLCKSHQKVHSGRDNRQYPCTVCNKLFVSKSYLNTHLKIHTGEKPFICEVCGKGFLTRVDLKIHSTMHTGEKSFVCEMCGKAFARRDALRCHRRSHTGERPYRCDICGQMFTQFSPMAIHKRLHTGERPYSCDVCCKTFVSRSTMMSHKKKHNPNETEANNATWKIETDAYKEEENVIK